MHRGVGLVQMCVRVVLCVRVCNREATLRVWGCLDGMGESSMIVVHGAGMSACRRQDQEMAYIRCKAAQTPADTRLTDPVCKERPYPLTIRVHASHEPIDLLPL
jgi:hypothetical protein